MSGIRVRVMEKTTDLPPVTDKFYDIVWYRVYLAISGVRVMVFNVTFNNISVISWRSVLLMEETGGNHRPAKLHIISHNFSGDRH